MAIYTKKISLGAFAKKGVDYTDKDLLTIANGGKQVVGQFGEQDVFLVKLPKGEEKNLTFNQTSINNCIDAYGADSVQWVGKQVRVWLILQNVQGKMVKVTYLSHPDATITDDGNFIIPGKETQPPVKTTGEDGIPYPTEEINPLDIPF
jgi:hypothetical protein